LRRSGKVARKIMLLSPYRLPAAQYSVLTSIVLSIFLTRAMDVCQQVQVVLPEVEIVDPSVRVRSRDFRFSTFLLFQVWYRA
jgi:hypothetical protein